MTSSKKKCKGCGIELSTNPNDLGYCNNLESDYCQRCFRIINYNDDIIKVKSAEIAKNNLAKLSVKDEDILFIVLDWTDLENSLLTEFKLHENTIYLVNKIDLLQKDYNLNLFKQRIANYLSKNGFLFKEVILTSSKRNNGIKTINELIKHSALKQKYYFLGKTNVGKSSLINALLKESNTNSVKITTSPFANTTLNFRKIKIHRHDIIDCPGYSDCNSVNYLADLKDVKLKSIKTNKVKNFQIKHPSLLFIEKIAILNITNLPNQVGSVTIYPNYEFDYHKTGIDNYEKIMHNEQILKLKISDQWGIKSFENLDHKCNLVIAGLGVIVIKNLSSIKVICDPSISCYLLREEII